MRPYLEELGRRGVAAFVDCSPAYIARDVKVLRRLSELTGIRIVTNTGYYGAAGDKFVPAHAYAESAAQLAARWAREWREGIDGTDIRPGFIKIGVDAGSLSLIDRKLVEAAALAHLATGLTIACHTGEAVAALETLEIVKQAGVSPEALIIVHADGIGDQGVQARLAASGAWVELDGVGPQTIQKHVRLVTSLVQQGHGRSILLSHDAGWYNVGQPGGGAIRPFTTISDALLPALREVMTEREIGELMVSNPARAFQIGIRRLPAR
jgi:phosphotriesterase-related protein